MKSGFHRQIVIGVIGLLGLMVMLKNPKLTHATPGTTVNAQVANREMTDVVHAVGNHQALVPAKIGGHDSARPLTKLPAPLADRRRSEDEEHQSIDTLSSLIASAAGLQSTPANLIRSLASAGLEPVGSRDSDRLTGSMIVIRTKNALPGTRYFSARFFSDKDGNYNPQDISFEVRPGSDLTTLTQSLQKNLGPLPKPNFQDDHFSRWSLADGRSLTIQTLQRQDILEGDPSVARSMEDVGTRVIAVSVDPPGHED